MEWSYPGRTPPPRLSNASLERMINMSSLLAFPPPPFPNQTLIYCSTDSATRQIKKVTLTKNKNKNKTTLAFSYICISAFIHPGYHGDRYGFFITLYRHLCGNFFTFRQRACLHSPAHEETLGTISSYMWFLVFFFFLFQNVSSKSFFHRFRNDVQSQWLLLCRMW